MSIGYKCAVAATFGLHSRLSKIYMTIGTDILL